MSNDNTLARGLYYNPPHPKAPQYVICSLSIQRTNFIAWLQQMDITDKGYVNVDILESKGGKIYAKLNEWKPGSGHPDAPRRNDRSPIPQADAQRIADEFGGEVVDSEGVPF